MVYNIYSVSKTDYSKSVLDFGPRENIITDTILDANSRCFTGNSCGVRRKLREIKEPWISFQQV